jgi:hypothetical protein
MSLAEVECIFGAKNSNCLAMEATTKQLILSSKNFQTEYPKDFKENDH